MKLSKVVHLYLEQLENYTSKIMKKYLEIYQNTWKNHGNIMEFCQSGKVGTLGAPCKVGTRPVKLTGLSSKSICNISCTKQLSIDMFEDPK